MSTLSPDALWPLLAQDLQHDEKILWAGQPDPSVLFTKADRALVPFSLLWGGFAFFWEATVIWALARGEDRSGNGGNLWFFVVMGAFFVFVGLYFIAGRFIYKRINKRHTYYAVTDNRVLVLTTLRGRHLTAACIDRIPTVQKSVNAEGLGTLRFGNARWWLAQYENTGMELLSGGHGDQVPTFHDIRDANRVYDLVNDLRRAQERSDQDEP